MAGKSPLVSGPGYTGKSQSPPKDEAKAIAKQKAFEGMRENTC